jgi:aerobic carbon-monoxide dehydrogenase medium subunit
VQDGAFSDLRLAYFAVGAKPTLAAKAAAHVIGQPVTDEAVVGAQAALADDLAPQDDLHASAATRLHLARVLLRRVLEQLSPEAFAAERKRA